MIWGSRTAIEVVVLAARLLDHDRSAPRACISGYIGGKARPGAGADQRRPLRLPLAAARDHHRLPALRQVRPGDRHCRGAITVVYVPQYFRVVRNHVISVREEPYVEAARALGAPDARSSAATCSPTWSRSARDRHPQRRRRDPHPGRPRFLGYGIQPTEAAEWGYDISRAIDDAGAGIWWTGVFPGMAIVLLVTGFTLVGEGLNDVLNPLIRRRRIRKPAIPGSAEPGREEGAA